MPYRLMNKELGSLPLTPENGYAVSSFDLGSPSVRAVVEDAVNAHGEFDQTKYAGARAVRLDLAVFATATVPRFKAMQRLAAFTSPGRRSHLYFDPDNTGEWFRVRIRGSEFGSPIARPGAADVSVGWSGPLGVYEAADSLTTTIAAGQDSPTAGVRFPLRFPTTFAWRPATDPLAVANTGTEDTDAVLRLWGPCVSPRVIEITTGKRLEFPGLSLNAQQYVEISSSSGTALLNGRASESLYQYLNGLTSSFFKLRPSVSVLGPSRIRYAPDSYTTGARVEVIFRPAHI